VNTFEGVGTALATNWLHKIVDVLPSL